jgi:hypothetical protein
MRATSGDITLSRDAPLVYGHWSAMPLQPVPLVNGQQTHTHFAVFDAIVTCAVLAIPLTVPVTPLPLSPSTPCHMFPRPRTPIQPESRPG